MSGSRVVMEIANHAEKSILQGQYKTVNLMGKATELSGNIALKLAKTVIKQAIQKSVGMEIGY